MRMPWTQNLWLPVAAVMVALTIVSGLYTPAPQEAQAQMPVPFPAPKVSATDQPAKSDQAGQPQAPDLAPANMDEADDGLPEVDDSVIRTELLEARQLAGRAQAWPASAEELKVMARDNLAMAERLVAARKDEEREAGLTQNLEQKVQDLGKNFESTRTRINRMGLTPSSGQVLQMLRSVLASYQPEAGLADRRREKMVEFIETEQELMRAQYDCNVLEQTLFSKTLPQTTEGLKPLQRRTLEQGARSLLKNRTTILEQLSAVNEMRRTNLNERMLLQEKMNDVTVQFKAYIMEKLFWTRAATLYDPGNEKKPSDLQKGMNAFLWITRPGNWARIPRDVLVSLREQFLGWTIVTVLLIALLAGRSRIRSRLETLNSRVGKVRTDSIAGTLAALVLTAVATSGVFLLILFYAKLLGDLPGASIFTRVFCSGIFTVVKVLLLVSLVWALCRDGGVGRIHFLWGKYGSTAFNPRNALWLFLYLGLTFFYTMIQRGFRERGTRPRWGGFSSAWPWCPCFSLCSTCSERVAQCVPPCRTVGLTVGFSSFRSPSPVLFSPSPWSWLCSTSPGTGSRLTFCSCTSMRHSMSSWLLLSFELFSSGG